MPISLPSYLHRNRHGTFGFRVVIPSDLRAAIGRHQLRLSLFTANRPQAKQMSMALAGFTQAFFIRLRTMNRQDAASLGTSFAEQLEAERERLAAEVIAAISTQQTVEKRQARLLKLLHRLIARCDHVCALCERPEIADDEERKRALMLEAIRLNGLADALAPRIIGFVAERHNMERLRDDVQHRSELLIAKFEHHEELKRQFEAHQREQQHIRALTTDIATETAMKILQRLPNVPTDSPPQPVIATAGATLTGVIEEYCNNQIQEGAWTPKTELDNRASFSLWVRIVGDVRIADYGFEQHRQFKSILQQLPAHLNKKPQYIGKTIDEVLALKDPPAAANTINKTLIRIASLFEWAVRYGYARDNVARGMTIRNPKRAADERKAFTNDDLRKLFGAEQYVKARPNEPYMYWAPLIALFTGARLNEIAQLHLVDFKTLDGVDVIDINGDGDDKRTKTKAGERMGPIQAELLRLGLLDYVNRLRQRKAIRLFPELRPRRDGYGQTVSKWFARYADRCGITEGGKVFHSFRHTVTNCLKQQGVPREKAAALIGHEDEHDVTYGRYGKKYQPQVMAEVVAMLNFEECTAGVKPFMKSGG